jgi:hypothetical protein
LLTSEKIVENPEKQRTLKKWFKKFSIECGVFYK